MRFGMFDHLELRGGSLGDLYDNRLTMIEAADEAGFHCYHKAEHHFTVLDGAPSSNVLFAAAAQRTERIRFGSLVYLLPFYEPVRLFEEICMLDHMCGGRLDVGVGKGVSPVEHQLWGNDPQNAQSHFNENFAILRACLAGDRLSHRGNRRQFDDAPLVLQPRQPMGPPIWYPGNYQYAGEHRLNTIVGGPTAALKAMRDAYHQLVEDAAVDWNPGVATPTMGVTRHVFVADTDEAAIARVQQAYPRYHENLASLWRQYDTDLNPDPSVGGDASFAMGAELLLAGSPDTVAAHVRSVAEVGGLDYFVGAFAWGDLTYAEVMASVDLFAREVMPRFT